MPRAIWNGSISFGLVTIPVKLVTAVKESEGIHFHFLHAQDKGRIKNTRTCEVDGKEIPWNQVARGYEYAKGNYVVVTDEELKRMRPEATQTVEIREFVDLDEVDPMLFDRPYYLEPEKKGRHAYALLREALRQSGKVGIAMVVLHSREYLAAVKPSGDALVLELMHFEDEIVDPSTLNLPPASEKTKDGEMKAAMMLIDAMAKRFDPGEFHDTYREQLKKMLDARARGEAPGKSSAPTPRATNVVDLVDVLERSLAANRKKGRARNEPKEQRPKSGAKAGRSHAARSA